MKNHEIHRQRESKKRGQKCRIELERAYTALKVQKKYGDSAHFIGIKVLRLDINNSAVQEFLFKHRKEIHAQGKMIYLTEYHPKEVIHLTMGRKQRTEFRKGLTKFNYNGLQIIIHNDLRT